MWIGIGQPLSLLGSGSDTPSAPMTATSCSRIQ